MLYAFTENVEIAFLAAIPPTIAALGVLWSQIRTHKDVKEVKHTANDTNMAVNNAMNDPDDQRSIRDMVKDIDTRQTRFQERQTERDILLQEQIIKLDERTRRIGHEVRNILSNGHAAQLNPPEDED